MPTATLLPTSDESRGGTLVRSSGTNDWSLLDDDDGGTNYVQFDSDGFVSMNYSDMPTALTVNSVTITPSYSSVGAYDTQVGKAFVKIGGTKYYSGGANLTVSGAYSTFTYTWLKNPATGAAWTNVEVNALIAGVDMSGWTANSARFSYVPVIVDYVANPAQVDVTRHVATLALHTLKNPEVFVRFSGNLDALGTDASPLELLADGQLEHTAGPVATGAGWEADVTKRRAVSPHEITINPMDYSVDIDFKDIRYLKALVWFPAYSTKNSGALEDGIPRMANPGATFTFTRAMDETFTDPVGDSVTVAPNVPGYQTYGLQVLAGASVSRAYFTNNSGKRTWNAAQGAFGCEIYFLGALAQDRVIAYAYHDANNWAKVWYDNASGKLKFAIRAAGVTTTITGTTTMAATTLYQVGVYWTGANLENGEAAYTMALYVNRVLEATGTATGAMTEAASSNFDIGSEAGSNQLRGCIRKVYSLQWVPTTTEMQRVL